MVKQRELHRVRSTERLTNCVVCNGSRLSRLLFKIYGYSVSHCRDCGVRFLNPPPNEATLLAIHIADSISGKGDAESASKVARFKGATSKLYLDLLSQQFGIAGGRLLDVGCGNGELLLEARDRGFEIMGIDIVRHAAATANDRLGEELVFVGTIESLSPPEASFDVVVLADVLEHIREPLPFLHRVYDILKPGGAVLVATPSLNSWSARLMRRYWMEYMPQHVLYFGERSLRLALESVGFASVSILPNTKVLDLDYICHRLERFPVPLVTSTLRLAKKLAPEEWVCRELQVAASGVAAVARKPEEMSTT